MKVYLASDHGGFFYKEEIQKYLESKKVDVIDLGNLNYEQEDDYPDYIIPLAKKVAKEKDSFGIVFGRSGNGEQIAANKVKGVRTALCLNAKMAKLAREHNHANVLSIGADFVNIEEAKQIVDTFLNTLVSSETRHLRRVEKIADYESSKNE